MDILQRFCGKTNTVANVAAETGLHINAVHYRVRRLIDGGLLRLAEVQKRAGRPIRHFTAVSDAIFVPDWLSQSINAEPLLHSSIEALKRITSTFTERPEAQFETGRCLIIDGARQSHSYPGELHPSGELKLSSRNHRPEVRAIQSGTLILGLDQATAFQEELAHLVQRYMELSEAGQEEETSHSATSVEFLTAIASRRRHI